MEVEMILKTSRTRGDNLFFILRFIDLIYTISLTLWSITCIAGAKMSAYFHWRN